MTYEMEMLPDEEIRAWMDTEIARLGEWFDGFTICWCNTGDFRFGQLYLWSEQKYDRGRPSGHPWGRGKMLCEIRDDAGLWLPTVQSEGRKLYYRLKKDYPVRRDLSKPRWFKR